MCKPIVPPAAVCVGDDLVWCPARRRLTLHGGRSVDLYAVEPIPGCQGGRGYRVEKHDAGEVVSSYDCFLADEGPGWDTCECLGFLRWDHCRHLRALRLLDAAGHLDESNPLADAPVESVVTAADVDEMADHYAREAVETGEWIEDSERGNDVFTKAHATDCRHCGKTMCSPRPANNGSVDCYVCPRCGGHNYVPGGPDLIDDDREAIAEGDYRYYQRA